MQSMGKESRYNTTEVGHCLQYLSNLVLNLMGNLELEEVGEVPCEKKIYRHYGPFIIDALISRVFQIQ